MDYTLMLILFDDLTEELDKSIEKIIFNKLNK